MRLFDISRKRDNLVKRSVEAQDGKRRGKNQAVIIKPSGEAD